MKTAESLATSQAVKPSQSPLMRTPYASSTEYKATALPAATAAASAGHVIHAAAPRSKHRMPSDIPSTPAAASGLGRSPIAASAISVATTGLIPVSYTHLRAHETPEH